MCAENIVQNIDKFNLPFSLTDLEKYTCITGFLIKQIKIMFFPRGNVPLIYYDNIKVLDLILCSPTLKAKTTNPRYYSSVFWYSSTKSYYGMFNTLSDVYSKYFRYLQENARKFKPVTLIVIV
jgi:hypothetical protein